MSAANSSSRESRFEGRIKLLKDGLVLQLVARRGEFWEAIEKIREPLVNELDKKLLY
jgi:hypothetical protein